MAYDASKGAVDHAAFAVRGKAAASEGLHSLALCLDRRPCPDARAERPGVSPTVFTHSLTHSVPRGLSLHGTPSARRAHLVLASIDGNSDVAHGVLIC